MPVQTVRTLRDGLACAFMLVGSVATAAEIAVNIPVTGTTPTTGFRATVNLTGLVTVSGNGRAEVVGVEQNFTIPTQSVPLALQGGSVVVQRNPSGTMNERYNNLNPPTPVRLQSAVINMLNGVPVAVAAVPVTVEINTSVLGIIPLSLDMHVNVTGAITGLDFVSTGQSTSAGSFYNMPGEFFVDFNAAATGQLDLGILGNVNLGTLFNETVTDQAVNPFPDGTGLPGITALTNIGGGTLPAFDNMRARFSLPDLGIELPAAFTQSGTINQSYPDPGIFGTGIERLNINWTIDAQVTLSNISYDLTGTVVNGVLLPEPQTITLAAIALTALVFSRRRFLVNCRR